MPNCKSTVKDFTNAKLNQFKSVITDESAVSRGILYALRQANYRIEQVGNTLNCEKGHAIISFDGITSEATITLI